MKRIKTPKGIYQYSKSTRKDKKLMTTVNGRTIHFGDPSHEHFRDRTGIYKSSDYLDPKRRHLYLSRASKIRDRSDRLTASNPESPNFHAINVLW